MAQAVPSCVGHFGGFELLECPIKKGGENDGFF